MLAFPSVAPVRWGFVKTGKANHMVVFFDECNGKDPVES